MLDFCILMGSLGSGLIIGDFFLWGLVPLQYVDVCDYGFVVLQFGL